MKFLNTLKIAGTLVLARTFGRYVSSGWNGYCEYARYEWRGRDWVFPLTPVDEHYAARVIAPLPLTKTIG